MGYGGGLMIPLAQLPTLRVTGAVDIMFPTGSIFSQEAQSVANYMIRFSLSNRLSGSRSATARARTKIASSMAGVTRPVNVFCWLG